MLSRGVREWFFGLRKAQTLTCRKQHFKFVADNTSYVKLAAAASSLSPLAVNLHKFVTRFCTNLLPVFAQICYPFLHKFVTRP